MTTVKAGALAALLTLVVAAGAAVAAVARQDEKSPYDGRFVFVRLRYESERGGSGLFEFRGFRGGRGPSWKHDYPMAEHNLRKILGTVTSILPGADPGNIIALGDPDLLKYPIAYMAEPGYWRMSEEEVENLRSYVLKGGFLIFDDFPNDALPNFMTQMQRMLPGLEPRVLDVRHPIFHTFFEIESLEALIPSYRGQPVFLGYFEDNEPAGRLLAIVNYRNDIGEGWENAWRETGFTTVDQTNQDFRFGVNYIIYGLTH